MLSDGLIAYSSSPIKVHVYCNSIHSLHGYWYGENAYLQIQSSFNKIQGAPDNTERSWGDTMTGGMGGHEVNPSFSAFLPIGKDEFHSTLKLMARMDAFYPETTDGFTFGTASKTVTKEITLFVISPEEMQLRKDFEQELERYNTGMGGTLEFLASGASLLWVLMLGPLTSIGLVELVKGSLSSWIDGMFAIFVGLLSLIGLTTLLSGDPFTLGREKKA